MNDPYHHGPEEIERRRVLLMRTILVLLIPLIISLLTILFLLFNSQLPPPDAASQPDPLPPIAITVIFFSALIVLVRIGRPTFSAVIVIGVWTLITTIGTLHNGISSSMPALLVIPICAAGLLIDWVACVSLATLAMLLVGSLAWLEQHGLMPPRDPPPAFLLANRSYLSFAFWAAIFITIAALTSLLAGGLKRALFQARAHAQALGDLSGQLELRVEQQTAQILEQERDSATLAERQRLAREIHDTLAQGLAGIIVQLGAAQRALSGQASPADQHIGLALRMARESLTEARHSVWNLRASALERDSLGDVLRELTARFGRPEIAVSFSQIGDPWPLPTDLESALLRVAQEALSNASKHARASRVAVLLEYAAERVLLSVSDDGVGFAEDGPLMAAGDPGPWGGFGLLGMRERLAALGGTLELRNSAGAQVIASLPRADCQRADLAVAGAQPAAEH